MRFAKLAPGAFMLVALLHYAPASAATCEAISMQAERQKLADLLGQGGMDRKQIDFLISGSVKRANELQTSGFNERGKACGIAHVRASVIGCLNAMMAGKKLSHIETGRPSWGKPNLTRGELLVVGFVRACRDGALDAFYGR